MSKLSITKTKSSSLPLGDSRGAEEAVPYFFQLFVAVSIPWLWVNPSNLCLHSHITLSSAVCVNLPLSLSVL